MLHGNRNRRNRMEDRDESTAGYAGNPFMELTKIRPVEGRVRSLPAGIYRRSQQPCRRTDGLMRIFPNPYQN